jgi:hypothetical protein
MPLPVLLNAASALSAIFWPHAAGGGGAAAASGVSAAKDASAAGAVANSSSAAAAGGAKVRDVGARDAPGALGSAKPCGAHALARGAQFMPGVQGGYIYAC